MKGRIAVAILLGALSLVLHLIFCWQLEQAGALTHRDLLFDTDLDTRLLALSADRHLGIKHPNLMPYFSPPNRLLAKALVALQPNGPDEGHVRRALGLLVVPVATGLKTALVFLLFMRLGFAALPAVILTVLEGVSFSAVIFGTVPESFGITALAVAMAYLLAVSGGELTRSRLALWIAVGVFATGVTISNVVQVTLLFWVAAWRAWTPVGATVRAAVMGTVIFAITGGSSWVLDRMLVPPKPNASPVARVTGGLQAETPFIHPTGPRRLLRFPVYLANAFAPPSLGFISVKRTSRSAVARPGLTLEKSPSLLGGRDPLGLSILLLLIAGTVVWLRSPSPLLVANCAIIAFSWVISVWGKETFLYSQHWQLAAVVLLSGVLRTGSLAGTMTAVLGVLTAAIAVNNLAVAEAILAFLHLTTLA